MRAIALKPWWARKRERAESATESADLQGVNFLVVQPHPFDRRLGTIQIS